DRLRSVTPSPPGLMGLICLFVICVKTIEEMFGDLKKHGFDLESTHQRHVLRLSRLTLAVCLLFIWLVALGEFVLANNLCAQVDRTDRHDLSIFRLGWDFLDDYLRLLDPIPRIAVPTFCSMSGG